MEISIDTESIEKMVKTTRESGCAINIAGGIIKKKYNEFGKKLMAASVLFAGLCKSFPGFSELIRAAQQLERETENQNEFDLLRRRLSLPDGPRILPRLPIWLYPPPRRRKKKKKPMKMAIRNQPEEKMDIKELSVSREDFYIDDDQINEMMDTMKKMQSAIDELREAFPEAADEFLTEIKINFPEHGWEKEARETITRFLSQEPLPNLFIPISEESIIAEMALSPAPPLEKKEKTHENGYKESARGKGKWHHKQF